MQASGPVIIALLFALRLGIPLAIALGLGYLYKRLEARWAAEDAQRRPQSTVTYWAVPCWEYRGCPAEVQIACPAQQRPAIPCWLAIQLVEGHIAERCFDCQIFRERASSETSSLTV